MPGRLATLLLSVTLGACAPIAPEPNETLHVLLRGESSATLTRLVEDIGGTVTHDLHSIAAIGATLTQAQLDLALASRAVSGHINDLALGDDDPDDDDGEVCKVRGQIELDIRPDGIFWPIYNKKTTPVVWESLKFKWPERLGTVEAITLNNIPLPPATLALQTPGAIEIAFAPKDGHAIHERSDLRIKFRSPPTTTRADAKTPPQQKEFTIEAKFVGDCSDKLVPGYPNNDEDYYYNTVAGIDELHRQGVTGKNVTVAVIDSGLWEHPALMLNTNGEQRVLARYDAITHALDQEVVDESGHGSHMSSIIAHSGPTLFRGKATGTFKGVAPDVNLVAVKVLDRPGRAHLLDIAHAIQWVIDHQQTYDIRVLNISLGQQPRWPYWEDPVAQLTMAAWAAGITVVVAADNEGPELATIGSPGNTPAVITVGAVTDSWTTETRSDDYIPDFSSRGPTPTGHVKPDIVALGGHMTGLTHPDSDLAVSDPENLLPTGELVSTGSSQAAAMVSGIVALLLELQPELSNEAIKCLLISSAEPAINTDGTLAYSPFTQGYGYVSALRAITLGETDCGSTGQDLQASLRGEGALYGPVISDEQGNPTLPGWSELISKEPTEKGMSETRRWGVKAHIERLDQAELDSLAEDDLNWGWLEIYLDEKARIERLAADPL